MTNQATFTFPNESKAYRAARDRLLAQEVELRRTMEARRAVRCRPAVRFRRTIFSTGCGLTARSATCGCQSCSRPAGIRSSSTI
jgi:predicted dithiol-disulfide oxidoreductase (DUF899 family)